ncbi:ephrin-B1-like [Centruroides sculpturatus]|uniref:ephrin-B1-like n=1 Tax=Centruroides sculpturatus TaxID=218467 RepID=UPI000C6D8821|nr:ephrin-B1-like [Centruroides sculpturatus]
MQSNRRFRIDNTDHIIDVNKGNIPFEYDQVNIICPVYSPGTKEEDVERYIIYNVSKEEYDSCRITNPNPRIIAVCDKPHQVMYFTITFRSFTPQPGGLEFRPGQDYYFVSTSTGELEGLHQRLGGRCATHNMKVTFKVCCDPSKIPPAPATTTMSTTKTEPATLFPVKNSSYSEETVSVSTTPRWFAPPTSKTTVVKSYDVPVDKSKPSSKKTESRDKLPNETRAKNEELINRSSILHTDSVLVTSVSILLLLFLTR